MKFDLHWNREYPLWYGAAALHGLLGCIELVVGKRYHDRGEGKNGWFTIYSENNSKQELEDNFREKMKDPTFVEEILNLLNKRGSELVSHAKKLNAAVSKEDLIRQAQEFHRLFANYCIDLFSSFYLVEIASQNFEKFAQQTSEPAKTIEQYSVPAKRARLHMISDFFISHQNETKRVEFVKKTYPFIGNMHPFMKPYGEEEIKAFIESWKPPKNQKQREQPKEKVITQYQEMLYLKDMRDDYRREAFYYAVPFMEELASRVGITLDELSYLLPWELENLDKSLIEKRKKVYILELNGKLRVRDGNISGEFLKEDSSETELKGIVGCRGIVKGKVQMIRTRDDIARFEEGKVLVAITTSPDHVVAMQRAVAFVTDEGGISCHAAIVAREMGKPCIVGTKNATATLKDGDLVEVDAVKGIVKKIYLP